MRLPKRVYACRTLFFAFSVVVLSAQLAAADFVFQFELSDVTTRGDCSELFSACETYLSTFCLRPQSETSGCSLGSSGRYGPDFNFPITRQISSTSAWPVSLMLCMHLSVEGSIRYNLLSLHLLALAIIFQALIVTHHCGRCIKPTLTFDSTVLIGTASWNGPISINK